MKSKKYSDEKLVFELKDLEIFKIKDFKLKLDTLQNYFFPRMDKLLDTTLSIARKIYGESICDDITIIKSPSHRPTTKYDEKTVEKNSYYEYMSKHVSIGVGGLRNNGYLIVQKKDGKPAKIPPVSIQYEINSDGEFHVYMTFWGYIYNGKNDYFFNEVKKFLKKHNEIIMILFNEARISYYPGYDNYKPLYNIDFNNVYISSPIYNFPIESDNIFDSVISAFIILMPIWHALVRISRGKETLFEEHIKYLKSDTIEKNKSVTEEESDNLQNNDKDTISDEMKEIIDNLDDYKHTQAGKWWQVISRDSWTCCSCGRSSRDGFILHVDHIVPRSKGGCDDISNLQTLCMKCNIGKSNKDQTNLRI